MSTPKYEVKRARVHLRKAGTQTFRDINTVDAATYSFSEDKITKQSTNEVVGDVAKKTIKTSGTLSLTMGSTEWANFVVAVRARESAQGAVAAAQFVLPALKAGEQFKLPHTNISAVAIPGKSEGVHFTLYKSGLIKALVDMPAETPDCSYSAGLAKRAAIAAGGETEYEVLVDDILNTELHTFYKWTPDLPQNIALIKPTEFGTYEVSGSLLLDETKPADGELGQFGIKEDYSGA